MDGEDVSEQEYEEGWKAGHFAGYRGQAAASNQMKCVSPYARGYQAGYASAIESHAESQVG